jgi:hypothetical protein
MSAMKKTYMLVAAVVLMGIPAAAKETQAGTIVSETSVACGSQVKNKKETAEVLCQEYVVRTETTEYHIRQEKHADQELIPVNTSIEFTLNKRPGAHSNASSANGPITLAFFFRVIY